MPGFQNPGLGRKQVVPWRESRWAEKSQVAGPGQLFLALAHSSNPELAVQNVTHSREVSTRFHWSEVPGRDPTMCACTSQASLRVGKQEKARRCVHTSSVWPGTG